MRYTIPLFISLDAFGVLVKGGPKTENYGDSLMGFGVQKLPVGPGTKPQQRSEDGVGSLGAKAGLASYKSDSGLGLGSRRLVSCSPRTKSWRRR